MSLPLWAVELLRSGESFSDDLLKRIVALGESTRETLLVLATDVAYRGEDAPGHGYAPHHALDLLTELPDDEETVARLVASVLDHPEGEEALEIVECLRFMTAVSPPYLIAGLAAANEPLAAGWLGGALAESGRRDEVVFSALTAAAARFPWALVSPLAAYDDPRAIPVLAKYIDDHVVGRDQSGDPDDACITAGEAIEDLGGTLTAEQDEKVNRAIRRQNRTLGRVFPKLVAYEREQEEREARRRRPGPNDPCPCGSGRKFKKCHEGDQAFLRRLREGEDGDAKLL